MAEWVYEQWQPAWPATPGESYTFGRSTQHKVLSYDGTLQDTTTTFESMNAGDVFYWSSPTGNPNGYYRKISSSSTRTVYLGTDPPTAIKDTLIDTIALEEGTVPDDGIHTDGYWYVKVKPAVKWIYERWQPKWPEPLGNRSSILDGEEGIPFNYDGTTSDRKEVRYMSVGTVLRSIGSTTGVRLKNRTNQTTRYLSEQLPSQSSFYPPLPLKDTLIDTIVAAEGTVPDDGVHSDQLYYVKVKLVFPTMSILRNGQWVEVETGYVLKDGVWKPIEEIYKLQNGQWVQA